MKLIQILVSLTTLSFFGATATPANVASRTDRPISLFREAIPAGVTIYGLDGNSNRRDGASDGPFSNIAKRAGENCGGSAMCFTFGVSLGGVGSECNGASNAYDDNAWYCGYTSRVSNSCTAIFACGDHRTCWAGWFLKQNFQEIGCHNQKVCGSKYFDNGNCRTTYDYCANCKNVG